MDNEALLSVVMRWAPADEAMAWRAVRATLATLAERLDRNECRHLAATLPDRIAPLLFTGSPAEGFDVDEFVRRVAGREGSDLFTAERHARAVFAALRAALPPDVYSHVTAELPKDYRPLVEPVAVMEESSFLDLVARQIGLDRQAARRTTHAVLATLAERIAPGEVDDLIARLPIELHKPLKEGRADADAPARKMTAEAFVAKVAEREGVGVTTAAAHVRAVMAALRRAVGVEEYYDLTVELPPEYERLMALV
jgi:uncharacterized protein (DUF2267 family)